MALDLDKCYDVISHAVKHVGDVSYFFQILHSTLSAFIVIKDTG